MGNNTNNQPNPKKTDQSKKPLSKPTLEVEAQKILRRGIKYDPNIHLKQKELPKRSIKKIVFYVLFVIFLVVASWFLWKLGSFWLRKAPPLPIKNFGVTFSKIQAEDLGLNWQEAYEAVFDDLSIKLIRIPVYWQEAEPEDREFNFEWLDFMLEKAEASNAEVILVVGRKVPRWPECHEPYWILEEDIEVRNMRLLLFMTRVINRYKDNSTVVAWQVENEPFLDFGVCPDLEVDFLDREIELVRGLSDKPIIVTDSGEFGMWHRAYERGDIFGSTLYRTVWTKFFGQFTYPLPPMFFRFKRGAIEHLFGEKPMVIIELQAEPWGKTLLHFLPLEEHFDSMNPDEFREILEYIKGTGFDTFYLWGVEWWYWLKTEHDMPEMWDIAKEAINNL